MGRLFAFAVAILAGVSMAGCGSDSGALTTGASRTPSRSPTAPSTATPLSCPGRVPASPGPSTAPASPSLVPPHGGQPAGLPAGGGFDAFAVVQPGVLARSGTPSAPQWDFLKAAGWKGVVDIRTTDDRTYSGFALYGFKYLNVPVTAGAAPTEDLATGFLCFVIDKGNQPVLVHDNSGIERVGLFVALFRYSVQGWQMTTAVAEETAFGGTLTAPQLAFLNGWASHHPPGELA